MNKDIKTISETVQHNCHIADARHAGDYTLCVYLLKMREMYRWEQKESFNTTLTTDDVGDWLTDREGLWDNVEDMEYKSLVIDGIEYDPFDNDAINVLMKTKGLVYNAGLGIRCRPHFFLAALEEYIEEGEQVIVVAGDEYARDMAAPPAMMQQNHIYIRRQSLRRMLWEKVEEWRMSGLDNPMGRAAKHYDFDNDVEASLDQMAETEIEMIIAHERGESLVGEILTKDEGVDGNDPWLDMISAMPQTHAEIMLRAVRDHYADALITLPLLLKNNNPASIHFYFGNMTAMRKKLAPTLVAAYETWHKNTDLSPLESHLPIFKKRWESMAKQTLAVYAQASTQHHKITDVSQQIETLIQSRIL